MFKIGVECENLEDEKSRWGIGRVVLNLLEEYLKNSDWQKKFKLYLYFKSKIPDDDILKNPILVKILLKSPFNSFNIFYHILMPIRAMLDRVNIMFFPSYMLPPLYLGKSVVMLTNDAYYEYKHGSLPFRYKLAYRLFTNWAAKKATKILAISNASKDELTKIYGILPEKIFVAHLGVKNQNYNPKTENYILYIGQMFPRRHIKELIVAFKKIATQFPGLKLLLIGKDKYNPPIIRELIKKTNLEFGEEKIIHYDYIEGDDNIRKIQKQARLFIYVSDAEAFGLPPIESACLKVPVVIKDNDLNRELFDDAAFFIKNSRDVEELVSQIKRGLTDRKQINYCLEKYGQLTQKFTWSNFSSLFFKEAEKLLNEKSS